MAISGAQPHGDFKGPAPWRFKGPTAVATLGAQPHGEFGGPIPTTISGA